MRPSSLRGPRRRIQSGNESETSSIESSNEENVAAAALLSEVENVPTTVEEVSSNATTSVEEIPVPPTNTTAIVTENQEKVSEVPTNSTEDSIIKEGEEAMASGGNQTISTTDTVEEKISTSETTEKEDINEEIKQKQNSTSTETTEKKDINEKEEEKQNSTSSEITDNEEEEKDETSSNGRMWPQLDPIDALKKTFGLSDDDETELPSKETTKESESNKSNDENGETNDQEDTKTGENDTPTEETPTSSPKDQNIPEPTQPPLIDIKKPDQEKNLPQNNCPSFWDGNTTLMYKVQCSSFSVLGEHPAGSLTAFLVFVFVCYCGCRVQQSRRSVYGSDRRGEYAALAVYDDLLDGNFNDELSSYCDTSDDSVETILSNWSGNVNGRPKKAFEMAKMTKGRNETNFDDDDFLTLEEING